MACSYMYHMIGWFGGISTYVIGMHVQHFVLLITIKVLVFWCALIRNKLSKLLHRMTLKQDGGCINGGSMVII